MAFSGSTIRSRRTVMETELPDPRRASTATWCSAQCRDTPFTWRQTESGTTLTSVGSSSNSCTDNSSLGNCCPAKAQLIPCRAGSTPCSCRGTRPHLLPAREFLCTRTAAQEALTTRATCLRPGQPLPSTVKALSEKLSPHRELQPPYHLYHPCRQQTPRQITTHTELSPPTNLSTTQVDTTSCSPLRRTSTSSYPETPISFPSIQN